MFASGRDSPQEPNEPRELNESAVLQIPVRCLVQMPADGVLDDPHNPRNVVGQHSKVLLVRAGRLLKHVNEITDSFKRPRRNVRSKGPENGPSAPVVVATPSKPLIVP
jgi:hypothetical protein